MELLDCMSCRVLLKAEAEPGPSKIILKVCKVFEAKVTAC